MTRLEKLMSELKGTDVSTSLAGLYNLCKELEEENELLKEDKSVYEYIWVRILDGNQIDATYFITDAFAEINLRKDSGWTKIETSKRIKND